MNNMTTEQILIEREICARMPYKLKVRASIDASYDTSFDTIPQTCTFDGEVIGCNLDEQTLNIINCEKDEAVSDFIEECTKEGISIADCKPYLRSTSSMTEEEKEEYFKVCDRDFDIAVDAMDAPIIIKDNHGNDSSGLILTNELEFMYKYHFDFPRRQDDGSYKTLIELGLAIEDKDNSAYGL